MNRNIRGRGAAGLLYVCMTSMHELVINFREITLCPTQDLNPQIKNEHTLREFFFTLTFNIASSFWVNQNFKINVRVVTFKIR